jgi:hypothetical protein
MPASTSASEKRVRALVAAAALMLALLIGPSGR